MIYELRIYSCLPGRLPALLKRFETATLKIWEKHGIKQAGFWTVLIGDGNHDLHYLLAWESLAEREKKWGGVPGRSGVDLGPRRQRARRADRGQRQQHDHAADRVLVGEVRVHPGSRAPCPGLAYARCRR